MGIVNITGDSYFAPSRVLADNGLCDEKLLRSKVHEMVESGADIIDVGACSTRPGSKPVGAEEEWRRLSYALPVIREEAPATTISVDTYHASVIQKAYDLIGPLMINDISAGMMDHEMLSTASRTGLPYIAMHMKGTPETMAALTDYKEGVVKGILEYFTLFAEKALSSGISDWYIDPGFGFAKTIGQNYELLSRMKELSAFGKPIVVGISRKSMIYKLLGNTPDDCLPPTQALHMAALERGASILRVHDVKAAKQTVTLYQKLKENTL